MEFAHNAAAPGKSTHEYSCTHDVSQECDVMRRNNLEWVWSCVGSHRRVWTSKRGWWDKAATTCYPSVFLFFFKSVFSWCYTKAMNAIRIVPSLHTLPRGAVDREPLTRKLIHLFKGRVRIFLTRGAAESSGRLMQLMETWYSVSGIMCSLLIPGEKCCLYSLPHSLKHEVSCRVLLSAIFSGRTLLSWRRTVVTFTVQISCMMVSVSLVCYILTLVV